MTTYTTDRVRERRTARRVGSTGRSGAAAHAPLPHVAVEPEGLDGDGFALHGAQHRPERHDPGTDAWVVNRSPRSMAQWCVVRGDGAPDDAALLRAVGERDRAALHELYLRHEPWLTARLTHRCSDPQLVEEAVQDTFVAVWSSAKRYSGEGEVAAWIWGIGIRTLLHKVRPRKPLLDRLRAQRHAPEVSAEDELLVRVEHGDLGLALERLSPELRQVVQATVLDGLTCREAGALLGVPAGTVKTRMMRARRELREALA